MSTRKSLLKRFDELINMGDDLLPFPKETSLDYFAEKQKWQTSCQHILVRTFGEESIYDENFADILNHDNWKVHITYGIALMEGAKEEIEKGLLYKIEHLISADLFDSVNEQAEYLLKSGFKDVAAVLGRVVIENTLKDIAKRENIALQEKIKLSDLNQFLWKEGVYAKNIWRSIQAQIDVGNDAAHGYFDKYDAKSVENMLAWIKGTLFGL